MLAKREEKGREKGENIHIDDILEVQVRELSSALVVSAVGLGEVLSGGLELEGDGETEDGLEALALVKEFGLIFL